MKQIIGKNINFIKRSLKPNSKLNLNVTMTDSTKKDFHTRVEVQTGPDGTLNLTGDQMRGILARCSTEPQRAFLLSDDVGHRIRLKCNEFEEAIDIETGIGETILREQLLGQNGVVGDLYYPANKKSKQAIIHIQALANEGFTVLELLYNAPKYGMDQFYQNRYFDISYVWKAIREVLLHSSTNAEKVVMIGHSKGSDLCVCAGSLFPELVHGCIISGSHLFGPVIVGTKYNSHKWEPIGMDTPELRMYGGKNDMFNCLNERGKPAIRRDSNGEWMVDYDVLSYIKKNRGFPIQRLGFLKVLAGLDDPCTAPNASITEEYTEYFKEGYNNVDVEYFSFGHLTTMVNSPVVGESMMKYANDKFVTRWTRNISDDAKIKEAAEVYRARNSLLSVLM